MNAMAIMVPPIYDYSCELSSPSLRINNPYIVKIIHRIDEIKDEEHDSGKDQEKIEQVRDTFKKFQVPRNLDFFSDNVGSVLFQFSQISLFR